MRELKSAHSHFVSRPSTTYRCLWRKH